VKVEFWRIRQPCRNPQNSSCRRRARDRTQEEIATDIGRLAKTGKAAAESGDAKLMAANPNA
jgi:hypothetical protein